MFDPGLNPGDVISNEQLVSIFKCSPQGGMRRSKETDTLVLISNHIKSVYDDRWIDDIFHYTGMGQTGDQSLNRAQNKTLLESPYNGIDVHLFEVFKPKEYTYIGRVVLVSDPYQEEQLDSEENLRKVWVFPLKLAENVKPVVEVEEIQKIFNHKIKRAQKLSDQELLIRATTSSKQPGKRLAQSSVYERNPYVVTAALRRANGRCQLCEQEAPFKKPDGEPYLEVHHIIWLSKGGEDTLENTVALCPNCHRKMHVLNLERDKNKLLEAARLNHR